MSTTVAQAPRVERSAVGQRSATRGWWWLGLLVLVSALFAAGGWWLLNIRGAAAAELLYWDAQRELVLGVDPPRLGALLTSDQPLVLYLVLLAGGATFAGACLAALSVVSTAHGWWALLVDGTGVAWLAPAVLSVAHPAFVLAGQYPAPVLRSLLLVACVGWLLRFTRGGATYALLVAAAALAGLGLLEAAPWILWVYLVVGLVLADPRSTREQTARVLMLLFPSVFLAVGRALLAAPVGGSAPAGTAHRAACDVASGGFMGGVELGCVAGLGPAPLGDALRDLVWFAPAALGLAAWAIVRVASGPSRVGRTGIGLLLLTPLLEPLGRIWLAPEALAPGPLSVLPLLLAAPLLAEYALGGRRGARGTVLLVGLTSLGLAAGLVLAWTHVLPSAAGAQRPALEPEDQALTAAALGPAHPWLAPYAAAAAVLDARAEPGDRVLLDDARLFPIVALGTRPHALVLPDHPLYRVSVQCPGRFADYVVLTSEEVAPDSARVSALSDFELIGDYPPVYVYARRAGAAGAECVGLRPA